MFTVVSPAMSILSWTVRASKSRRIGPAAVPSTGETLRQVLEGLLGVAVDDHADVPDALFPQRRQIHVDELGGTLRGRGNVAAVTRIPAFEL